MLNKRLIAVKRRGIELFRRMGTAEAATTEELTQLLADESVAKIRLTQPLTLDRELEIKRDIVIDFVGLAHNFGTHHIYINETPQSIEFRILKERQLIQVG